ncbi:MAG TPA: NUDIX hydrolase [Candidatus Acidoferrales bacterium]
MKREYPDQPVVGVGGVVVRDGRALLIRRGGEPLKGQWSIPGGTLELGETIAQGVVRELREETGLEVRVLDLIEVFERISPSTGSGDARPQYHFVILDYLCAAPSGDAVAGSDVTHVAWAAEEELARYALTPTATRVVKAALAMAHSIGKGKLEKEKG